MSARARSEYDPTVHLFSRCIILPTALKCACSYCSTGVCTVSSPGGSCYAQLFLVNSIQVQPIVRGCYADNAASEAYCGTDLHSPINGTSYWGYLKIACCRDGDECNREGELDLTVSPKPTAAPSTTASSPTTSTSSPSTSTNSPSTSTSSPSTSTSTPSTRDGKSTVRAACTRARARPNACMQGTQQPSSRRCSPSQKRSHALVHSESGDKLCSACKLESGLGLGREVRGECILRYTIAPTLTAGA